MPLSKDIIPHSYFE
jgi:hypothetical protein